MLVIWIDAAPLHGLYGPRTIRQGFERTGREWTPGQWTNWLKPSSGHSLGWKLMKALLHQSSIIYIQNGDFVCIEFTIYHKNIEIINIDINVFVNYQNSLHNMQQILTKCIQLLLNFII